MIPFNRPFLTGKELEYIEKAVQKGKISGNGFYTKQCHKYFTTQLGFQKTLLTSSCTDALEMAAILAEIEAGDEVIMPSYTFVSTANAFVLRGAKIVFADSYEQHPNINADAIEQLITPKTKAIVVVHYGGVACDMDKIMNLAQKHNLVVIEDAAQAIDSFYKDKPLGSIGDFGTFSFHETKNIISGEGGLLAINSKNYNQRAEIIWEKGTNRTAFFRGEVDKYGWVDIGSSFLPSEVTAAFLYAQLEHLNSIQERRKEIWSQYYSSLQSLTESNGVGLPTLPDYATNNAHLFYLVCNSEHERSELIQYLKANGVHAVFHYLSLHKSPYFTDKHDGRDLPFADHFSNCLVRLPLFYELTNEEVDHVCQQLQDFYKTQS